MPKPRRRARYQPPKDVDEEEPIQEEEEASEPSAVDVFLSGRKGVDFFSTGCTLLDLVLGGGIARRRISNVVGDKSTGKTLIAVEACVNFARLLPKGLIRYCESESAFDTEYAGVLGMPLDRVTFTQDVELVEQLSVDVSKFAVECKKKNTEGLYILDSLDALSDLAESKREPGENTYGGDKPKQLSQMFRKHNKMWASSGVTVIVVSQIRDNIGVTFGKKYKRSGGKALDFYASQVLYLAEIQKVERTISNIKRATGIIVRAKCEKSKVGMPFRQCDFTLVFGYGIHDLSANLEFLNASNGLKPLGISEKAIGRTVRSRDRDRAFCQRVAALTVKHWNAIEKQFLSVNRKYD